MIRRSLFLFFALFFLLCSLVAHADDYHHRAYVFGTSGEMSNATYFIRHTIGEPLIGETSSGELKSGFWHTTEALVGATDIDADGLPDDWELSYFGNLSLGPDDDPDGDQLTLLEEYQLGADPTDGVSDTDGDNMLDRWEIDAFADLSQGPGDDYDGDAISNYIEYKMNTVPTDANDLPASGIKYEYDALGRIKEIIRIPSR